MLDGPTRDAVPERRRRVHDLCRPLAAREDGDQTLPRIVGLVDDELLVGDELAQRVGDPLEEGIETLLREDLVEHVGERAIGLDVGLGASELVGRARGNEPHGESDVASRGSFGRAYYGCLG